MLFDRAAIEAGKHVVEHWKKIVLRTEERHGPRSCKYCMLYREDYYGNFSCQKCPIYYFTKKDGCQNTPYKKIIRAKRSFRSEDEMFYAGKMRILVDQIFIKSLLLFDIRGDYFNKEKA